jgi:hypothetical protein
LTKQTLVVVSLLAFLFGGAAAVVLNYPPRHPAASRQAAETPADAGRETASRTDASAAPAAEVVRAEEGATAGELDDRAAPPEEAGVEFGDRSGESAAEAENSSNRARRRPATSGQVIQNSPAPRRYASGSGREATSGGGGVAAYTFGGVKKTGQGVKKVGTTTGQGVKKAGTTIGRTFGKIGGVFND